VYFMPIQADAEHVEYLQDYYKEQLGIDIATLPELILDRSAFTPSRAQWSGEGLGEQIRQSVDNRDAVVIGVTGLDLYLRGVPWQFAFSWRVDDRIAVVSYARMDPRFFLQPPDNERLHARLRRMVTKDLGIMLYGLHVSANPSSPLYRDIGGIEELDGMGENLAGAGFPVVNLSRAVAGS
jgi:predicted Zn-dependent protease